MNELSPIKFKPFLKSVIWGGNKICEFKRIEQQEPSIGESWEISAVPGHESVVAEGKFKGRNINNLIEEFGDKLLGKEVVNKYGKKFPLLIKFIDANDNLSVQVHPDDKLAGKRHGCPGKTEMWYIIDAEPEAKILTGLTEKITAEEYAKKVDDGSFPDIIARYDSHAGDVFFLPAGRVHAIGAGNLLAEIQESSDITYRIYDYNRVGADGKPRELHTQLAKDAIDYNVIEDYRTPSPKEGDADATLVNCEHFKTRRCIIDGKMEFVPDGSSFIILMGIKGSADLEYEGGTTGLQEGETILIPAAMSKFSLIGNATVLVTTA